MFLFNFIIFPLHLNRLFNEKPEVHQTYFSHMTLEDTERLSKHGLNVILAIDLLGNVHLSFLGFARQFEL